MGTRRPKKRVVQEEWERLFSETDAPTENLIGSADLGDGNDVEQVLEDVMDALEDGYFLRWEAVIADENDLALTRAQREALERVIGVGDEDDDELEIEEGIRWIDERPRPSEPWYCTVQKVAAALLAEGPFDTAMIRSRVVTEGWPELVAAIEEHASALWRPPDLKSPVDVVPVDLQHKLWLQSCFFELEGLGQPGVAPLHTKDESWRLPAFVEALEECRDSVEHLGLTLERLFDLIVLPPADEAHARAELLRLMKLEAPEVPLVEATFPSSPSGPNSVQ
ncbi:hypothetical protein ACFL59_12610 [Planctomycetota bacterium]